MMSLKYFQFVAMYRNFSKAAEHFYIGQPALSRQIASLEKELGVQLFDRDTRNVCLTEAGQVLYDNCDLLVRHHAHVASLMEAAKKGHEGHLSIAAVREFGPLFKGFMTSFIEQYPKVSTRVEDIPFDELADSILHGVYDAAFTLDFAVPDSDKLVRTPVCEDNFVAVMRPDLGADLGDVVTARELLDRPLIIPRHVDPPFLKQLRLAGRTHRGPEAAGIEYVPNTSTALLQTSLGLGIAFIPTKIFNASADVGGFKICTLGDIDSSFSMVLVRRKDNAQKTLQNFVELIRDQRRGYRAPARPNGGPVSPSSSPG